MAFLKLPDDVSECLGINCPRVTENRAVIGEKRPKNSKNMAANFASRGELWSHRAILSCYSSITRILISIFSLI